MDTQQIVMLLSSIIVVAVFMYVAYLVYKILDNIEKQSELLNSMAETNIDILDKIYRMSKILKKVKKRMKENTYTSSYGSKTLDDLETELLLSETPVSKTKKETK